MFPRPRPTCLSVPLWELVVPRPGGPSGPPRQRGAGVGHLGSQLAVRVIVLCVQFPPFISSARWCLLSRSAWLCSALSLSPLCGQLGLFVRAATRPGGRHSGEGGPLQPESLTFSVLGARHCSPRPTQRQPGLGHLAPGRQLIARPPNFRPRGAEVLPFSSFTRLGKGTCSR